MNRHAPLLFVVTGFLALVTGVSSRPTDPQFFGRVTVSPAFELDGRGENIDSLAFWTDANPVQTLMLVTAKRNQLVEVWKYPFQGGELAPITGSFGAGRVNGVVVDQDTDLVYLSQSKPSSRVYVFSLPDRRFVRTLPEHPEVRGLGSEPNLDLLQRRDGGATRLYVTADRVVHVLDAATGAYRGQFIPDGPRTVETILVDDYHRIIYIPDENDHEGIYAFNPDGTRHEKCDRAGRCSHRFGVGLFDADAEGIVLYSFPPSAERDGGRGFIVVADQRRDHTDFEFFDRQTWAHLGTLVIRGVSNTDGIASTQRSLPAYPLGLFAAVNDDESTVGVGWDVILDATGLVETAPDRNAAATMGVQHNTAPRP